MSSPIASDITSVLSLSGGGPKKSRRQRSKSATAAAAAVASEPHEEQGEDEKSRRDRLQKFRDGIMATMPPEKVSAAWQSAAKSCRMAERKCAGRWTHMLEEEHEGDFDDSWKERIFEMMPSINREDVESREVSLEDVCSRGRAHLERAHQESEGSYAMARSLAEAFGAEVTRQDSQVDEQRCEELLGSGDTPSFPHSGQ